ncbi:MAG TPA: hypothetical protein VEJ87_15175 [Acidimicrobiales bacterium]|nr:hypothetical protein [Acidimicrobiales bacterium]
MVVAVTALAGAAIAISGNANASIAAAKNTRHTGIALVAEESQFLAGYQIAPTGGLASASVTFTVPSFTCTTGEDNALAEQFDGVYTDQEPLYAFVTEQCYSSFGARYMYAFGAGTCCYFSETGVAAGDVVVTSIFQSGSSTYAEIHDLTNGAYWFADSAGNLGFTTADIGSQVASEQGGEPAPNFKKIKFWNATVNGDYLGFDQPTQYDAYIGSDLAAESSSLTTNVNGSTFTVSKYNPRSCRACG